MRILSMTATFGKLNHQTLTLKPGLNIIEAPNEWGKSTWCAFLSAMLYGIDTSQRTTQAQLSDKEHYAPWNGHPMSGRLEIEWHGKNITVTRSTKGRIPMGEFQAYETDSGLPVPELTADNCGQVLLGVERSVFLRAGFIRQTDIPVTQDDALRRRLNALVTTGDENNAGDRLAEKMKELKNACRHNKTGALPQAEAQRAQLTQSLAKLTELQDQLSRFNQRQVSIQQQIDALHNHRQALAYDRAKEGMYRMKLAQDARLAADARLSLLQQKAENLPDPQILADQLTQLRQCLQEKASLEAQGTPSPGHYHEIFGDLSPSKALEQARHHKAVWDTSQPPGPLIPVLTGLLFAIGIGLSFLWPFAWLSALPAVVFLIILYICKYRKNARVRKILTDSYGTLPPGLWIPLAEQYAKEDIAAKAATQAQQQRLALLEQQIRSLTGPLSAETAEELWRSQLALYEELEQAQTAARQAALRENDLQASVISAQPPSQPDSLTLSEEDTAHEIARLTAQLQQLQLQAGQCMGQIEALGQAKVLRQQLQTVESRIARLTDFYEATVLALAHLEQASLHLQQRFAPQLTAKAKELFAALTGGRYNRLLLDQQLQLQAGAADEDGLRTARWRSDGTIDQLYLALRLAVSEQLTPQAPLVLDDVLLRFDDTRHGAAMALLLQQAKEKQILLFTCQSREGAYSPESIIKI